MAWFMLKKSTFCHIVKTIYVDKIILNGRSISATSNHICRQINDIATNKIENFVNKENPVQMVITYRVYSGMCAFKMLII